MKDYSHDELEHMFLTELKEFSSGKDNIFSSIYHNRYMHAYFEIMTSIGDQPERRLMNYMMGGNSNFLTRFGYSGDI